MRIPAILWRVHILLTESLAESGSGSSLKPVIDPPAAANGACPKIKLEGKTFATEAGVAITAISEEIIPFTEYSDRL